MQMQKAAAVGVLRKKISSKISQNSQETPRPEETTVNFAKFLRTLFLQKKADIAITKQEMQIVFAVKSWMQCFMHRLKSQGAREESHHSSFCKDLPDY